MSHPRGRARVLIAGLVIVGALGACRGLIGYEDGFAATDEPDAALEGSARVDAQGPSTVDGGDSGGGPVVDPDASPYVPLVCRPLAEAGAPPSCQGLGKTCGPDHDDDCCAWSEIEGGTYSFLNAVRYSPARVCDFRLDRYEVTVGRYRSFLQSYRDGLVHLDAGSGKNPNAPSDVGLTDEDLAMLADAVTPSCPSAPTYVTWSEVDAGTETLPVNCIPWSVARAFCIWDGGRLPTAAEWDYAAVGGTLQRPFPWGPDPPDTTSEHAIFGCWYNGDGGYCTGRQNIATVGTPRQGNGPWGQADMIGNVGEWVHDWSGCVPTAALCDNCICYPDDNTTNGRLVLGANFHTTDFTLGSEDIVFESVGPDEDVGVRCAR